MPGLRRARPPGEVPERVADRVREHDRRGRGGALSRCRHPDACLLLHAPSAGGDRAAPQRAGVRLHDRVRLREADPREPGARESPRAARLWRLGGGGMPAGRVGLRIELRLLSASLAELRRAAGKPRVLPRPGCAGGVHAHERRRGERRVVEHPLLAAREVDVESWPGRGDAAGALLPGPFWPGRARRPGVFRLHPRPAARHEALPADVLRERLCGGHRDGGPRAGGCVPGARGGARGGDGMGGERAARAHPRRLHARPRSPAGPSIWRAGVRSGRRPADSSR